MKLPSLTPAQQAAAVDRAAENVSLTSGAGCGKTFVLARRFTELLLRCGDAENPLSRFVALTFTEKAALEMRQRVRTLLSAFAASAKGDDRRKLQRWIDELPQARISTIHSFCSSLLRTYAVEAGIDPNFRVCADELLTSQLTRQAAEDAVLAALEAGREEVATLVSRLGFAPMTDAVVRMIGLRTHCNPADYLDAEAVFRRWERRVELARQAAWERMVNDGDLSKLIARIEGYECSDQDDKLNVFRRRKLQLAHGLLNEADLRHPSVFEDIAEKPGGKGSKKAWSADVKQVREDLKALGTAFQEYAEYAEEMGPADRSAAETLAILAALTLEAVKLSASRKRRLGLLDFDDLLLLARRLVHEVGHIRTALSEGIDQMLIDEGQDTDAFQLSLLLRLLFDTEDLSGVPEGRLFLVGDAKQSIYRFRGAQVEVFQQTCRRLGEQHAEALDLSFRTHEAGVEFANDLFRLLMPETYRPIRAHRQETPAEPSVEVLLAEPDPDVERVTQPDATDAMAAATADRIEKMVHGREKRVWDAQAGYWRAVEYRDVAVLFARMTHSLEYERQLQRRGIPYYVVAGTGFFQQQEVYDLLGALSVVDNPLDDVSWLGLLRSAMIGLDDNALAAIALSADAPYLPAMLDNLRHGRPVVTADLSPGDADRLRDTADLVGRLHGQKNALGIAEVLERLLEHTGYEGVLLGRFQGRRPMGNVRRVVEFARQADADGLSLADFVARMREQVMSEQRFEQAAVAGEEENVVRLMTIHQAKGLEFPVVVLPDLNAGRQRRGDRLLHRDDWGLTIHYNLLEDEDAPVPLVHRLALRAEDTDQAAEDIRRFYVAVTRHEDHLVLVGADWRDKDGAIRPADCTLRMLDDLLGVSATLERNEGTIRYGDGRYEAAVARVRPADRAAQRRQTPPGEKMMSDDPDADELARRIVTAGGREGKTDAGLPLLSPLPDSIARAELAVTALTEFAACPAMYRYRYELRMPEQWPNAGGTQATDAEPHNSTLDPLALGTLLHRCMELLDFARPQDAEMLLQAALLDTGLEGVPPESVLPQWRAMLERFCDSPLRRRLSEARETCRELDFVMEVDGVCLRGQIDLLWQDAEGHWRVLDYKTDRLGEGETPADRGSKYALQLEAYAMAAERFLGEGVTAAELLFLRGGETWGLSGGHLSGDGGVRLRQVAGDLLRARRAGHFPPRCGDRCGRCPFAWLCEESSAYSDRVSGYPDRQTNE